MDIGYQLKPFPIATKSNSAWILLDQDLQIAGVFADTELDALKTALDQVFAD